MFNDSYFSYKVAVNTSHLLHSVLKQTTVCSKSIENTGCAAVIGKWCKDRLLEEFQHSFTLYDFGLTHDPELSLRLYNALEPV